MSEQRTPQREAIPDFQAGLAAIINKPLTAETIDAYAESALDDLGELIQQAAEAYPARYSANGKELEDAACAYFGLGQMEETLDHIAAKAAEIQALDAIIAGATDEVITPPDAIGQIEPGSGGRKFEEKEIIPRLKTLLFILANDFGVDADDREQLRITKGAVEDNMVRQESYYLVEASTIGRTVLVCDELANATFVFDDDALSENGISRDELMRLTKDELYALLKNNPQAGQRIVYSKAFVPNIISALAEPATCSSDRVYPETEGRYLHPKAPEGVLSLYGLGKALGVSGDAVVQPVIKALQEQLDAIGDIRLYRFGAVTTEGYTPEQQGIIRQYLEARGYFDEPPEDFVHQWGLHQMLDVEMNVLSRAINKLGDDLGEVRSYKSARRRTPHYSPEQQEMIRDKLEVMGTFDAEAPEGFSSKAAMAKHYGVSPATMKKVIGELGEELGEIQTYRFKAQLTAGYSPEQQEIVRRGLEKDGLLHDDAPEGYLSISSMIDSLGASYETIVKVIDRLGETLGETQTYKFNTRMAAGYSSDQQEMIRAELASSYIEAPDGYLTVAAIAERLGISHGPVAKAVEKLREELGETQNYRFGPRPTPGYSPHQQEVVMQHIIANSLK